VARPLRREHPARRSFWHWHGQDGAVTITLPMSHVELASWLDAAPEAVAWHLNTWRQRGIISTAHRGVTVVDAAGLDKICGSGLLMPAPPLPSGPIPLSSAPEASLNCSIFFTDIAEFGDPRRDDDDRRVVRDALYRILPDVFDRSSVPWDQCLHEDRGDGILTIVPPNYSTVSLVDPLVALLAGRLKWYNRQAGPPVRMQLRAALHVGPVYRDMQGLGGHALIHTARMLDAPILKEALASTQADLAFMVSTHIYETVIRHATQLADPSAYRRVRFQVKESKITSWMYLAGVAKIDNPGRTGRRRPTAA
jgi:Crp-like helix-turn-helix domain